MDIAKILGGLKNKVLDAGHYELLKNAYDLQQENIEQLKNNNMALKESNVLLQEKNTTYLEKINQLEESCSQLTDFKRQLDNKQNENIKIKLSPLASTIFDVIQQSDVTDFYQNKIHQVTSLGKIETEAGLDELSNKGLISCSSAHRDHGLHYYLTPKAKVFLIEYNNS